MNNTKLIIFILILTLSLSVLTACGLKEAKGKDNLEVGNVVNGYKEEYVITITDETVSFVDDRGRESNS